MHRWGASCFIILMFLHMGRVFLFGAYKYPRELNWIIGVLLLMLGLAEGFTGYLLPWDQTAYWATTVGININATAPFLGPFLAQFLQGGAAINGDTLPPLLRDPHARAAGRPDRADHAAPVPRDPPRRDLAAVVEGRRRHRPDDRAEPTGRARRPQPRRRPRRRPTSRCVPSDRVVERQRVFKQYKEDVKERGKKFFPYAMLHDTIMSLVVVVVIIALSVVWKFSTPGDHTRRRVGLAREAVRRARRPGDDQLRSAARLVLLLPLLPAPDLQVAGVGDPRHDRRADDLRCCC